MSQLHFFALPEDWPSALGAVEKDTELEVALAGRFLAPAPQRFRSLVDLPNLGQADGPQTVECSTYLVAFADNPIQVRRIGTTGDAFFVDQLLNPDTVAFTPAGRLGENVIIAGRIAAAHDTLASRSLMKLFRTEISTRFRRVKAFQLGEGALAKWKSGCRLTIATQSPPEYDLSE